MPKKILFLSSDTGGGHKANATAIRDAFNSLYPNQFEFEIIDVLSHYSFWPFCHAPAIYAYCSIKKPFLWKMLFTTSSFPGFTRKLSAFIAFFGYKKLHKKIVEYNPDLIISVHPLVQDLTIRSLSQIKKRIPFAVITVDLDTAHVLWFNKDCDLMFVPSDVSVNMALSAGVSKSKIHLSGLPVREMFTKTYPSKTDLRIKLGFDPVLPLVMVIGGGDGVGPVKRTVYALNEQLIKDNIPMGQIAVIAGKNKELFKELSEYKYKIPVQVNGFVENIAEYMFAADCIVTKAGPGTIAEALVCGLPIILFGFIPGQEEGNIDFVVNNRAGLFEKNPAKIAEIIHGWFNSNSIEFDHYKIATKALGKPNSSKEIVETLHNKLFKERSV